MLITAVVLVSPYHHSATSSVLLSATTVDSGTVSQDYLPVNYPVTFSVSPVGTSKFSDGTYFHWLMQFSNGTHLYDQNSTNTSITLTLPRWDKYSLTVISHGVVVAYGVASYVAEEVLSAATPTSLDHMYRLSQVVSVDLQVIPTDSANFTGTLEVRVWQNKVGSGTEIGTGTSRFVLDSTAGGVSASFVTTLGGKYDIVFQVLNNVSQITSTNKITVADHNQYGYFWLIFSTDGLPADYHTHSWQTQLQTEVKSGLSKTFGLFQWQLDVNITEEDNTTVSSKRASSSRLLLVANVYLLPVSLDDRDVQSMNNVTDDIVANGNNKKLSFTVGGETVSVKEASRGSTVRIVEPITVNDKKSYLTLAASLGAGGLVLLIVAIAIIVGAIAYYRKKYRSLEVRYSRLRQGPMRFTFTSEGENLEEDDWNDDEDGKKGEDDEEDEGEEQGHVQKLSSFRPFRET